MKSIAQKIGAFIMAVVILISTTSFTIDLQYCGKELVDTAIFSMVNTCDSEQNKTSTDNCCESEATCCYDEQIVIGGVGDLTLISISKLKVSEQILWTAPNFSSRITFEEFVQHGNWNQQYIPPLLSPNFQKLHQIFLL
jgi:hypothetical protein